MNIRVIRLRIKINAVNNFIIQIVPVGSKNDKHKELGISEKRLIITVVTNRHNDSECINSYSPNYRKPTFFLRFLSNGYFTTMSLQNERNVIKRGSRKLKLSINKKDKKQLAVFFRFISFTTKESP